MTDGVRATQCKYYVYNRENVIIKWVKVKVLRIDGGHKCSGPSASDMYMRDKVYMGNNAYVMCRYNKVQSCAMPKTVRGVNRKKRKG